MNCHADGLFFSCTDNYSTTVYDYQYARAVVIINLLYDVLIPRSLTKQIKITKILKSVVGICQELRNIQI